MEHSSINIINNYIKNDTHCDRICNELSQYSAFGSRFYAASLPFFKLYAPLNQISSNIDNAVLIVTTLRNMASGLKETNSLNKVVVFSSGAVTILSVMNLRCATIISVSYDIFNSYQNSDYSQLILNTVRFIVILHPLGLELQVALAVFQILLEARNSYRQYNKENYLEAIASAALTAIKVYQLQPQVKELQEKYFPVPQAPSISQHYGLMANPCSGQLPEDYTFDDIQAPLHEEEIDEREEENSQYEQFLDETIETIEQVSSLKDPRIPLAMYRKWLFKGTQDGCQGPVSIAKVESIRAKLDAHRSIAIQFNQKKVVPSIEGGTCTAMSLEFIDTYFEAKRISIEKDDDRSEMLIDHLVKLGQKFSSSSQEMRDRQAAYNTIEVRVDHSLGNTVDYSKNKVQSLTNYHSLIIDYSSSEIDVDKLNHECQISKEVETLPKGTFLIRMIKSANNEKLEEYGHSLVYIKEHGLGLFYDPNHGVRTLSPTEHSKILSEEIKSCFKSFETSKVRFYRVQPILEHQKPTSVSE